MKIELSMREMVTAGLVGVIRQAENITQHKRKDARGTPEDFGWQAHIEGAMGEYAFARGANTFWSGAFNFRGDDVGRHQVRTRSKDWYDLMLFPTDADDRAFVLLTGVNGQYEIRGWILGKDGKLEKWWKDPAGGRPAFFVPQTELRPLAEL